MARNPLPTRVVLIGNDSKTLLPKLKDISIQSIGKMGDEILPSGLPDSEAVLIVLSSAQVVRALASVLIAVVKERATTIEIHRKGIEQVLISKNLTSEEVAELLGSLGPGADIVVRSRKKHPH